MLPVVLLVAAGGLWTSLPTAERLGPLVGTLLPILLCVALATAAAGRPTALATMVGALAAFVGSVAWTVLPALGGAMILGIAYAERGSRVRTLRARAVHVGLSVLGGAAAGALTAAYADGLVLYRGVAVVMSSVLSLMPLFIAADDPRVRLLEGAARRLGSPLETPLLEGVELLRCGDPSLLDRETSKNLKKSWTSLERLLEARLAMLGGPSPRKSETAAMVTAMLDRQITEHVATLTRAYAAVTTMGAAEVGIDDSAVREAHARGEALDEQSRAIVEVAP